MDLKTIFGIVETIIGIILLFVATGGFYFVITFSGVSLPVVNPADPTTAFITLIGALITLLKTILYSFNFLFLFSSILLILDGILKIRDED